MARRVGSARASNGLGCRDISMPIYLDIGRTIVKHHRLPVLAPFRGPPWSCRRAVVVMQPAEHGDRRDRAGEPGSDAFARERGPLADPLVGPSRVEVAPCVFSDDLLQVR